jgi:hypothetical protein
LNVDSVTLKLAAPLAYIAPPAPFDPSGWLDDAIVNTEHAKKWDFDIRTVKLNPPTRSPTEGSNTPVLKLETWGDCSIAKAPPKTEDEPRELSVTDTAVQFVALLRLNTTREFVMEVLPKEASPELNVPAEFIIYTPTTTATVPPIACTSVTRALSHRWAHIHQSQTPTPECPFLLQNNRENVNAKCKNSEMKEKNKRVGSLIERVETPLSEKLQWRKTAENPSTRVLPADDEDTPLKEFELHT